MAAQIINDGQLEQTNPPPYVPEPKSYALSGKIMLSAIIILFAVVVIMVCLHIYARWYILRARRRRTRLVFYIEPENPSNIVPGLDTAVLQSLPTFTFTKADKEVLECAVCLSEFEAGEKGRLLPKCKHCFHVECIDMWFHSHATCPLCRSPVDAGDLSMEESDEVVVELTQSQLGVGDVSSSFGGRRKGIDLVGVSMIEVPRRNSDESGPSRSPGFKSPTSRILSLRRILSRETKSPLPSPSPSPSGVVSSSCELDVESGRVDSLNQDLTPR